LQDDGSGGLAGIYYAKKIIDLQYEMNEEKLKVKEKMLRQLQSIDLSKYSFPNENKPKTEYTYANTYNDYMNKSHGDDNVKCEMPNLCRRSRLSPNTSMKDTQATAPGALSSTNAFANDNTDTNQMINSSVHLSRSLYERLTSNASQAEKAINARTSFIEYFKSFISTSSRYETNHSQSQSQNQQQSQIQTNANTYSEAAVPQPQPHPTQHSRKEKKLVRNLVDDLDDDPVGLLQNMQQPRFENVYGYNKNTIAEQSTKTSLLGLNRQSNSQTTTNFSSSSSSTTSNIHSIHNARVQDQSRKKSSRFCLWCPLVFFLALLPFMLYGLNRANYNSNLFEDLSASQSVINLDKRTISLLDEQFKNTRQHLNKFYFKLVPEFTWQACEKARKAFGLVSEKFFKLKEKTLQTIIDYQPAKILNQEQQKNKYSEELNENLNSIKEKALSEILANLENKETSNVDRIKRELDQKFNYTFTLMSNRLSDQLMEIEMSKTSHERELKQMRSVLTDFESKYGTILKQLEEQQAKIMEHQQQPAPATLTALNNYEFISFEKIEEFINKSFYLYNADKTGMTDFASELVGASILFTRCTENYDGHMRWLSFFDIPITKIHVSSRVVIQGSVQPGNCWSFKGQKADLFIKLAAKITPKSFSIEHIPKELSITGSIDSAPQNFTVYGYTNKNDIRDDNRLLLGNFRYDNNSKNTLQFFSVQHEYTDRAISVIELKIESNSGNPKYTCLYKFRVHGQLYNSQLADATSHINQNQMDDDDKNRQNENLNNNLKN
jgi:SUN domain-containing protein 1/2